MKIINGTGGVFYSPNMIQFSARRPENKIGGQNSSVRGKNNPKMQNSPVKSQNRPRNNVLYKEFMDRINMMNKTEDYTEFLEKLKDKVSDNTIPEFGIFAPIAVDYRLKDNSGLVFQIKSVKDDNEKKELSTNFINSKTGGLSSLTTFFANKAKLLEYINSIDNDALNKMVIDFRLGTE